MDYYGKAELTKQAQEAWEEFANNLKGYDESRVLSLFNAAQDDVMKKDQSELDEFLAYVRRDIIAREIVSRDKNLQILTAFVEKEHNYARDALSTMQPHENTGLNRAALEALFEKYHVYVHHIEKIEEEKVTIWLI